LNEDVSKQWHLFFRTELPSKIDRARVALWEARNLNIAGRIRAASAWHPGGRVLVVIGAAHKPFLDLYLAQMMDIQVVQLGDVLPLTRGGRTGR
jgi:pheromone shutdown protein TraB